MMVMTMTTRVLILIIKNNHHKNHSSYSHNGNTEVIAIMVTCVVGHT